MLTTLYGERGMAQVFSSERTVSGWLAVEAALARAQAELGIIEAADAAAIGAAAHLDTIDLDRLWADARNVGYPILPLVRQLAAALPDGPAGRVHYGATTQDIMDSALSMQLGEAADRMLALLERFGDALAAHVDEHAGTVIAARTHAQQAVPTTFGAKLAVVLDELTRHRERMRRAVRAVRTVSLFGAGGTGAALGPRAHEVRALVARDLGLSVTDVPWHVARDRPAELGSLFALAAATANRFAREVIDLSRTEIGEVREAGGHHRGASSTMPQKANPIACEAIIGFGVTATSLLPALMRAMEAGHERAAGEWQVEWLVLPRLAEYAASALALSAEVAEGLQVFPDRMRANLGAEGGLIMAEAYMMRLAPRFGREEAHDVVYAAAQASRRDGTPLAQVLAEVAPGGLAPESYLGEAERTCVAALAEWRQA